MSRRVAVVEEEFDDDTDLPLPASSLPHTGARGAILEAISDDEGDSEPGPATPSYAQFARDRVPAATAGGGGGQGLGGFAHMNQVTDITPYKTCVWYACGHTPEMRD